MKKELNICGKTGFVSAACYDLDRKKWFAHTSITSLENERMGRQKIPKNASLHFCSLMYKEFFEKIVGFSEEYREGQGYEDNDFLWKLEEKQGVFKTLDFCVTHHFNTKTNWPIGGLFKNKLIYEKKWKHKI